MESFQKEIQRSLLKYGSFKEIIKKNGVITIIDFAISNLLNLISKRIYRSNSSDYGLSEAFFRSRGIDRWSRYVHVVNEIRKIKAGNSVLEVGSGGRGISEYLSSLDGIRNYELFMLDIRKDAFKDLKRVRPKVHPVIGDGCRLPFRDKAFDVVVSVDTIEHIPKPTRHNFFKEFKRVCKKKIVITCPMQCSDGIFQGKKYDITFQYLYETKYGVKEPNTAQHIAAGHPTIEEIKKALPHSTIYGYKNCDIWLKYMLFSSKPFLGLFCGLLYYFLWKRNDDKPPYWGAIIVSDPQRYSGNVFY